MLKVDHLFKSYKTGRITYEVLKDVCFEVKEREFVAVIFLLFMVSPPDL